MKKLIAFVLAAVLVLSMVGCTKNPESLQTDPPKTTDGNGTESTQDAGSTEATQAENIDYFKAYEGVEFTTVTQSHEWPEGQDDKDNLWIRSFGMRYGAQPKVLWSAAVGDAMMQKQNAAIATGEIPDVMNVTVEQYMQLVKSDLVEDLTGVIDTYMCPELKQCYAATGNKDLTTLMVDGKIYGIPQTNGVGDGSPIIYIRKDWMEKLHLEEPKCIADLEKIAKAFMENDPDGNGQADTYGMPILPVYDATYGGFGNLGYFFLNMGGAAPAQWRVQEDGTVIYGSLMEGAKEALSQLNKWYEDGLIPYDFATWSEEDYNVALSSGRAGIGLGPWWAPWGFAGDAMRADENADWVCYSLPKDPGGTLYCQAREPAKFNITVIRKGFECPEAIMCAINRMFTAADVAEGIKTGEILVKEGYATKENVGTLMATSNVGPIYVSTATNLFTVATDGLNKYLDGTLKDFDEFKDYLVSSGINPTEVQVYKDSADQCFKYLKAEDGRHEFIEQYITYMARVTACNALFSYPDLEFVMTDFSGTTPAMTNYSNFLSTFETEAYTNMIMGKTDGMSISDYFDQFVENYLKQGGDEITAEIQAITSSR